MAHDRNNDILCCQTNVLNIIRTKTVVLNKSIILWGPNVRVRSVSIHNFDYIDTNINMIRYIERSDQNNNCRVNKFNNMQKKKR